MSGYILSTSKIVICLIINPKPKHLIHLPYLLFHPSNPPLSSPLYPHKTIWILPLRPVPIPKNILHVSVLPFLRRLLPCVWWRRSALCSRLYACIGMCGVGCDRSRGTFASRICWIQGLAFSFSSVWLPPSEDDIVTTMVKVSTLYLMWC